MFAGKISRPPAAGKRTSGTEADGAPVAKKVKLKLCGLTVAETTAAAPVESEPAESEPAGSEPESEPEDAVGPEVEEAATRSLSRNGTGGIHL